jgi:prolyl-tRNA editing enzyme YbaK/EbsC (Cys-tRNA(Pro) deacylase)
MSQVDYPPEVTGVKNWFVKRGFDPQIRILSVSAKTSADAASALGCELGRIAKSLIFYNVQTQEPVLIIASGLNRVDKDKVGSYLRQKIKTAGPEYVLKQTGFPAGGVPPVAHKTALRTLIDKDLLRYDTIWAAAGHPHALFCIPPDQLVSLTEGSVITIY